MDVDFKTIDDIDNEFFSNNIGYIKWYVMVNNKWKPTDPLVMNISFAQWVFYYLIMKRSEMLKYNKTRQLFELNSFINNPQVFHEYYKNTYGDKDKVQAMEMTMDELGMGMAFKDEETNTTLTQTEVLDIINKIPGFQRQEQED